MQIVVKHRSVALQTQQVLDLFVLLKGPKDALRFEDGAGPAPPTSEQDGKESQKDDRALKSSAAQPTDCNSIIIEVAKLDSGQIAFQADALGGISAADESAGTEALCQIIAGCLGFSLCMLFGMNVKDSDGNKQRPEIPIYIRNAFGSNAPSRLEYTKEKLVPARTDSQAALEFRTCSPIMHSLLASTSLYFKTSGGVYCLSTAQTGFSMAFCKVQMIPVCDMLTATTVQNDVLQHICAESMPFSKHLWTILSGVGTESDIKAFFRKLSKGLKGAEYNHLCEIVERAPIFYDARGAFIANLENFLMLAAPLVAVGVCDYLEIKRLRVLRRAGTHSLQRMLDENDDIKKI